ncbi:MAG: nitrilase-related carbon-nitrogen hydrolase [Thermovirgaceae bacterium]|nr:nitrilase-related carbon-nitrogen hydrolase [Thermovirgaceae bacterium]
MKTITIHIIQSDVIWGNPEENISKMKARLDSLPDGPSVVVLPELWTCSYDNPRMREHSLSSPDALAMLMYASKKKGLSIVGGSMPCKDPSSGAMFNRCHVIDDTGSLKGSYDKGHLFPLLDEPIHFSPGDHPLLFDLYGITAAAAICYDIRFPEFIRSLALAGTDILFVPAQWPVPRIDHWTTLLRARAIENQIFVIGCNRCGEGGGDQYGGHSLAVAPDGIILTQCSESEEKIMTVEITPSLLQETRNKFPFTRGMNPLLYAPLTSLH